MLKVSKYSRINSNKAHEHYFFESTSLSKKSKHKNQKKNTRSITSDLFRETREITLKVQVFLNLIVVFFALIFFCRIYRIKFNI